MAGAQFFIDKIGGRPVVVAVYDGPLCPLSSGNPLFKGFFIGKMVVAAVDFSGSGFSCCVGNGISQFRKPVPAFPAARGRPVGAAIRKTLMKESANP